jgi:hypothetical protein
MKLILILLSSLLLNKNILCRSNFNSINDCTFLTQLEFQNGRDTVQVIAYYHDYSFPNKTVLREIEKSGILKANDYSRALILKPEDCEMMFVGPFDVKNDKVNFLADPKYLGTKLKFTCIVVEGYKFKEYPFFLISAVEIIE